MLKKIEQIPGSRLFIHALIAVAIWFVVTAFLGWADDLMNYYVALVAMYAIAMFGMVILVGLSGQVSLGNGALMAVGGYVFALTSLHWQTVPILGWQWNAVWSMVFAGLGGVIVGLLLGFVGARLRGPYLAGLTLGVAVGVPAIANRFPSLLGGENGLILTVPFPEGGYSSTGTEDSFVEDEQDFSTGSDFEEPIEELVQDDGFSDEVFDDSADELTVDGFADDFSGEEITSDSFEDEITEENFADVSPDTGLDGDVEIEDDTGDLFGIEEIFDPGIILERYQASIALAAAVIVGFIALNLVRGRQGKVWRAVRDDPVAAAVSGVFPAGSKVSAFVVSSLFAAISGAVLAQILAFVGPGAFGLGLSLSLLVGIVLGGRISLVGALIGAVLIVWLPEFVLQVAGERGWEEQITNNAPNLIYGLLVVLVVLLVPGGIVGTINGWIQKLRSRA
jgi:ABC-type branched-subunit amino acid transport system permease subunit